MAYFNYQISATRLRTVRFWLTAPALLDAPTIDDWRPIVQRVFLEGATRSP
jgi:hypothetical protein